jgi:hypothetical protein
MYQMHAFYAWVEPVPHTRTNFGEDLPLWLPGMMKRSIVDLAISFTIGTCAGGTNLYFRTPGQAWHWYAASFVFTSAHLVFSKEALRQLEFASKVDVSLQDNVMALRKWLRMNKIRFVTSELPAFCTALVAVLMSIDTV